MPDIDSVIVKTTAALDEAYAAKGSPSQSAQIAALQSQVSALQSKIAAATAAAQADKAADAANAAGQGVLDALA